LGADTETGHEDEKNPRLFLHYGDLSDSIGLCSIVDIVCPDEVYHLAGQSQVGISFKAPVYTADIVGNGTLRLLQALKTVLVDKNRRVRFFQAASSEILGDQGNPEHKDFYPRSPYACAKLFAYWITVNYRESYNMFCSNGILFNHESPRRGETFVTRKITLALARILAKKQKFLYLGNLDSTRYWGYAGDFVRAMWYALQQDSAHDYIISGEEKYSVRDFLAEAFGYKGLDYKDYVKIDPRFFRPLESRLPSRRNIKDISETGWKAETDFKALVRMMVDRDIAKLNNKK
jgi:GDPmannose 4,6-dehydratase